MNVVSPSLSLPLETNSSHPSAATRVLLVNKSKHQLLQPLLLQPLPRPLSAMRSSMHGAIARSRNGLIRTVSKFPKARSVMSF